MRLSKRSCPVLLLTLLACGTAASARPVVFGGGVIADNDPQNDVVGGGRIFAVANTSLARVGLCTFSPSDNQDYFEIKIAQSTQVTVMTVPLTGTLGNAATADTLVLIATADNSAQYVINNDAGTDQTGTGNNSLGSVARASLTLANDYAVRVSNLQSNTNAAYALIVSAYTGTTGDFEEQEPNNGPAFPLTLGLRLGGPMIGTGFISAGGDSDFYAVDMRRGEILAAVTTPVEGAPGTLSEPDTVIEIIGTNGATVLCSNDDAGTDSTVGGVRGSCVRFSAPTDGRYFIKVRGFNTATNGLYALTAALLPPPSDPACIGDLNADGAVNTADLTIFLGKFGVPCP